MINGEYVQFENTVINLGVVFDCRLDWADHIRGLQLKVYATLYTLRKCRLVFPSSVKLMLIRALVVPHLSYCNVLFYNANIGHINRIIISVKACIRLIHNLSFSESTLPHFNSVLGSSLTVFYKVRVLAFIFGIIRTGTPEYLSGFF